MFNHTLKSPNHLFCRRSGEGNRLPPMWPGFDSRTRRHMWVEFVVGSCSCFERFFSGFPLSSKTNISKFQFHLASVPITVKRIWSSRHGIICYTNFTLIIVRMILIRDCHLSLPCKGTPQDFYWGCVLFYFYWENTDFDWKIHISQCRKFVF